MKESLIDINVVYLFWGGMGLLLHFLKSLNAAKNRKEVFFKNETWIFYGLNAVTTFAIVTLGNKIPGSFIEMNEFSALLVGLSSSSMLSGLMKIKEAGITADTDRSILKITKDTRVSDAPPEDK